MSKSELLTCAEMNAADHLATAAGVPSLDLMENAGRAVAEAIVNRFSVRDVVVLCGPGNNGGDGYVVARHLKQRGWNVWVEALGDPAALKGDAAEMARIWDGESRSIATLRKAELVVDAMFGAGLSRPLDRDTRAIVEDVNGSAVAVVAIDVPSGLSGDLGRPLGDASIRADLTVTFFRKKPGHLLFPGRALCGDVLVRDIGIPDAVLASIKPRTFENGPDLWLHEYPWPQAEGHKYDRGHSVVVSGPRYATGAARLAAGAALRVGSGLVSVASPLDAADINAAHLTAVMVKPFDGPTGPNGLSALLSDRRLNAVAIGPGSGVGQRTRELVMATLASGSAVVLDADALTSFADNPDQLYSKTHARTVLTPHQGEFERVFSGILTAATTRLEAARNAADLAGCIVVLKGPDTIVAAPGGRAAINANAPPWLATAGAGDVLTGLVVGLLAQGMEPFAAACAAVWLQGEAAAKFGCGLIAGDLVETLPAVLGDLMAEI